MNDEPDKIDTAAARIIVLLGEWVEASKCSAQAAKKDIPDLLYDFSTRLWP